MISILFAMSVGQAEGGASEHSLAPCPASPNCVNSLDPDRERRVPPIAFHGSADAARARLLAVLASFPRARVVKSEARYLHAEFVSSLFGFVDDVELVIDADTGVIHLRSASRVGYYDFGVNRRRAERIRAAFARSAGRG